MTWKLDSRYVGYPAIEPFIPTLALSGLPSTTSGYPNFPSGLIVPAEDPVWGAGEFIFAKAAGTIRLRALVSFLPVWNATNRNFDWNAIEAANTTLSGRMVGVAMSEQGSVGAVNALTVGQWGWFMVTGLVPINGTATVAADTAFAVAAAGQIGANAISKQVLNARIVTPATQTVTATAIDGVSGGSTIRLSNVDGFFVGCYLSGTGVGAAAICQAVDQNAKTITASVVNAATVTGTVTGTYNNATIFYNVAQLNRPIIQGPIT